MTAPTGAAADPYPSRPRGRERLAGTAVARSRGVRPRDRGLAHGGPVASDRERDAALRGRHGPAVGRVPARARIAAADPAGRRAVVRGRLRRRLHAGARLPSRRPTCTRGPRIVGDVGGVRIIDGGHTIPPTPPPDIDVEAWHESIELIASWKPERLAMTHFGASDDVEAQLAEIGQRLDVWAALARDLDSRRLHRARPGRGRRQRRRRDRRRLRAGGAAGSALRRPCAVLAKRDEKPCRDPSGRRRYAESEWRRRLSCLASVDLAADWAAVAGRRPQRRSQHVRPRRRDARARGSRGQPGATATGSPIASTTPGARSSGAGRVRTPRTTGTSWTPRA